MKTQELNRMLKGLNQRNQIELLKSELEKETNSKKSWRFSTVVFVVTTIILLFMMKCEGDKLAKEINTLKKSNSELLINNVQQEAENDCLQMEIECLKNELEHKNWEIHLLDEIREVQQKYIDKYENQKPALVVTETTKSGNPAKTVKAVMVDKSSKLPNKVTIETCNEEETLEKYLEFMRRFVVPDIDEDEWKFFVDSIVPTLDTLDFDEFEEGMGEVEYVFEWEIEGEVSEIGCATDTMNTKIKIGPVEGEADTIYTERFEFTRPFLSGAQMQMMVNNCWTTDRENLMHGNCFAAARDPRATKITYDFTRLKIDYDLQRKSKVKHWVARGMRVAAMAGYAALWHSDKQFAITENGIGPYEEGNSFLEGNLRDRNIAAWKAAGEGLIWGVYLGSEGVEQSSYNNYRDSFQKERMRITQEQNYIPANKYHY